MGPLLDRDDRARLGVVKAGREFLPPGPEGRVALGVALGLLGIDEVIEDETIAALPGDGALRRCRDHLPASRVMDQALLVLIRGDDDARVLLAIPFRLQDQAAIDRE